MRYIENLESVNKKMIIDENGLKITQDAILLSEFIKKYFNTKYRDILCRDFLFFINITVSVLLKHCLR